MSAITTTGANRLLASIAGVRTRVKTADTLTLDLDSLTFDDTTDATAVAFNQGLSVAAGKAITSVGALALNMAPGAFNFSLKLADALGAQKFTILDSASVEVARIDSDGNAQFDGSMTIGGSLFVQGTQTFIEGSTTAFADNHLLLNDGYTAVSAQSGGLVVNYLPTATATTTSGAGVFTAGVDGVSNPTVTTAGAATFANGDLVLISGSANNDGVYEVSGHVTGTLTIYSTANGTANQVEDWTNDQFIAGTDTGATLTKCTFSVLRAGTDGAWETGSGSTRGITYTDVATGIPGWTDDGTVVRLTTSTDNVTIGSATAGGKLFVDGDANEIQLQVEGFTTQTTPVAQVGQFAAASSSPMLELQLDATAFTGVTRGLQIDFANASSISNAADVYGIELLGETNAGAGNSIGAFFNSGWDYAIWAEKPILLIDNQELAWGTDFDAELVWTTAAESGYATDTLQLHILTNNTHWLWGIDGSDNGVAPNNGKNAGGTVTIGDVVAVDSSTGKYVRADADSATASIRRPVGLALFSAVLDETLLVHSLDGTVFQTNTDLSGATRGAIEYLSETAGQLTTTAPSTTGTEVWIVGYVENAAAAGTGRIRLGIQFVEVA